MLCVFPRRDGPTQKHAPCWCRSTQTGRRIASKPMQTRRLWLCLASSLADGVRCAASGSGSSTSTVPATCTTRTADVPVAVASVGPKASKRCSADRVAGRTSSNTIVSVSGPCTTRSKRTYRPSATMVCAIPLSHCAANCWMFIEFPWQQKTHRRRRVGMQQVRCGTILWRPARPRCVAKSVAGRNRHRLLTAILSLPQQPL